MKTFVMIFFASICFTLCACVSVWSQQPTTGQNTKSSPGEEKPSLAKISFSETMWDFGYVPKAGKVGHTYKIKNAGEDTLVIVKVRTTCGCTSAPLPKEKLAPGEIADLEVIFDPNRVLIEQVSKTVQIITNDPNQPFAEVRFGAKIGKTNTLVKITPAYVNFDTLSQGTGGIQTLTMENISGENLSLTKTEIFGESISLDLTDRVLNPGESVQVTVKLKEDTPSGNLNSSFTLDFECSKIARISIPVTAFITEK